LVFSGHKNKWASEVTLLILYQTSIDNVTESYKSLGL